ncbi:tyrosine-type recombinase/integrase [Aquimarina brevivitae]|uniref:Tyrosine recombinase XerC n=1 Tax=Aquimarina brevivitae TaxID=323412 RepID=A0A4Q7P0L6_9FLAO|nr:tyrosine-type recombinase/integrase [Aquimarina brevivitae]RZS93087.1 integrase/recombinase XerC [Aquimarina brevivitae]
MAIQKFIDHLTYEKQYSPNTITAYHKDLTDFAEFYQEQYQTDQINKATYTQIRPWIINLIDKGIVNRSVNRKISTLKSYYNFLRKIGEIKSSPLDKHIPLKAPKKLQVPFSTKEIEQVVDMLQAQDDFEGVRDKLIIELFYATGIRRSELIHIKHQDVSLSNKTIKVLGKRKKERYIPLLPTIIETIKQYSVLRNQEFPELGSPYLFLTKKGVKMYETLVYRIVNNYFSKASSKVKKSPHILRHSFATHLLNEGADLNAVKELLGHSSLAATQVYTHQSVSQLAKIHKQSHPRNKK